MILKILFSLSLSGWYRQFTELSQNISRHFNKKSMMREKVFDKSLSIPLPQNVKYGKK